MKKTALRLFATLLAVLCLGAPALMATPAQASSSAAFLKGTWVGPCSGFFDGSTCGGEEKITVTKVKGHAAKGTWQYRSDSSASWSKPSQITFVVRAASDGTWEVYGSDDGGSYEGVYTPWTGQLELAYMAPGDVSGTLFFKLTKK